MYPLSFVCVILTTILFSGVHLTPTFYSAEPQEVDYYQLDTELDYAVRSAVNETVNGDQQRPMGLIDMILEKLKERRKLREEWLEKLREKLHERLSHHPLLELLRLRRETSSEMNTGMPSIMEAASMNPLNGTENAPVTTLKSDNDAPSTTLKSDNDAPSTTLKSDNDAPSTTLKSDNDAPSTTEAARMKRAASENPTYEHVDFLGVYKG